MEVSSWVLHFHCNKIAFNEGALRDLKYDHVFPPESGALWQLFLEGTFIHDYYMHKQLQSQFISLVHFIYLHLGLCYTDFLGLCCTVSRLSKEVSRLDCSLCIRQHSP